MKFFKEYVSETNYYIIGVKNFIIFELFYIGKGLVEYGVGFQIWPQFHIGVSFYDFVIGLNIRKNE